MTHDLTQALRMLAVLLHYPDDDLYNSLDSIASAAGHSQRPDMGSSVREFVAYLKGQPPIHAQECYTAVFDMDPAATLNMTYHMFGDNEKRAGMLAELQHAYEQAGWERITGELPDYLPMMLEFLAVCEHPEHAGLVWECLQGLDVLVANLEKTAPAYAALLHPLAHISATLTASRNNGWPPAENTIRLQEINP